MNKGKLSFYRFLLVFALITLPLFEGGCAALRPSRPVPDQDQPPLFIAPTLIPIPTATPTTDPNAQPADCRNDLAYIKDLHHSRWRSGHSRIDPSKAMAGKK